MDTLYRFATEEFSISIEGPEDFVRSEMAGFGTFLGAGETVEEDPPDSLRGWYRANVPPAPAPSMQDHILIFAWFLNRMKRQFIFVPADMKAAFDAVGRPVPKSLLQILGSLKRDHNLLYSGQKRGEYCLTPRGIKVVEGLLGLARSEEPPESAPAVPAPKVPEASPPPSPRAEPVVDDSAREKFSSLFRGDR